MMATEKKNHDKGRRKEKEEESPTEKILGDEHWRRWEEKNKLPYVSQTHTQSNYDLTIQID